MGSALGAGLFHPPNKNCFTYSAPLPYYTHLLPMFRKDHPMSTCIAGLGAYFPRPIKYRPYSVPQQYMSSQCCPIPQPHS